MNRLTVTRAVLLACSALFVAGLVPTVVSLALIARIEADPSGGVYALPSIFVGLLVVAPILLVARLGNYVRLSTLLSVGVGLSLAAVLLVLVPGQGWVFGLAVQLAMTGLAWVAITSLLLVVHESPSGGRGLALGLWAAMMPAAFAGLAGPLLSLQMWRLESGVVAALAVLVLILTATGRPVEPASTFEQIDLVGGLLWVVGITALTYLLGRPWTGVAAAVSGAVAVADLAALVVWCRNRGHAALIAPALLSRPVVTALTGVAALWAGVAFTHVDRAVMVWMSRHNGADAISNAPAAVGWLALALAALLAGFQLDRGAGAIVANTALFITVFGLGLTAWLIGQVDGVWGIAPGLIVTGIGLGTLAVWLLYRVFAGLSRTYFALAAGLVVTAVYLGRMLGTLLAESLRVEVLTGAGFGQLGGHVDTWILPVGAVTVSLAGLWFGRGPGRAQASEDRGQ